LKWPVKAKTAQFFMDPMARFTRMTLDNVGVVFLFWYKNPAAPASLNKTVLQRYPLIFGEFGNGCSM